jgi:hypothetical protein
VKDDGTFFRSPQQIDTTPVGRGWKHAEKASTYQAPPGYLGHRSGLYADSSTSHTTFGNCWKEVQPVYRKRGEALGQSNCYLEGQVAALFDGRTDPTTKSRSAGGASSNPSIKLLPQKLNLDADRLAETYEDATEQCGGQEAVERLISSIAAFFQKRSRPTHASPSSEMKLSMQTFFGNKKLGAEEFGQVFGTLMNRRLESCQTTALFGYFDSDCTGEVGYKQTAALLLWYTRRKSESLAAGSLKQQMSEDTSRSVLSFAPSPSPAPADGTAHGRESAQNQRWRRQRRQQRSVSSDNESSICDDGDGDGDGDGDSDDDNTRRQATIMDASTGHLLSKAIGVPPTTRQTASGAVLVRLRGEAFAWELAIERDFGNGDSNESSQKDLGGNAGTNSVLHSLLMEPMPMMNGETWWRVHREIRGSNRGSNSHLDSFGRRCSRKVRQRMGTVYEQRHAAVRKLRDAQAQGGQACNSSPISPSSPSPSFSRLQLDSSASSACAASAMPTLAPVGFDQTKKELRQMHYPGY